VVELKLFPGDCNMATIAAATQSAVVGLLFLVTVIASMRGFAVFFVWLMAFGAQHAQVTVPQFKIRGVMIESLLVEEYNGCVSADMFAVAGFAQSFVNAGYAPVKSFFVIDVLFNIPVVMAIQAQFILKGFFKKFMTLAAILFKFGMCGAKVTWHQGLFHFIHDTFFGEGWPQQKNTCQCRYR
jgi:hypothetical protein